MTSIYTETRIISLNSENANTYRNGTFLSDVLFGFNGLLKDEPDILQRQITLVNAQLPVSFYVVNYANNVFVLRKMSPSIVDYTITLTVGNYNSTTFIALLQSTILTATGLTFTITIDKASGKLTFSATVDWRILSTSATTTAEAILGLDSKTSLQPTLVTGNYVGTCPYPLNLLGIKQLQVKSSYISANNFSSNANGQDCLLATIPVDVGAWGLITYESASGNNITFHNLTLDDFDIQIVDAETGKSVNFNGVGWTMTILIHLIRRLDLGIKETNLRKVTPPISNNLPPKDLGVEELENEDLKILQS